MQALRLVAGSKTILGAKQPPLEQLLAKEVSDFWEPLFNNLGHVLRKLNRFTEAIQVHKLVREHHKLFLFYSLIINILLVFIFFRKSLLLGGSKADAWACLGVCYASQAGTLASAGNNTEAASLADEAMEALNKSLALRPGDDVSKFLNKYRKNGEKKVALSLIIDANIPRITRQNLFIS